jgi:hypothetical protein
MADQSTRVLECVARDFGLLSDTGNRPASMSPKTIVPVVPPVGGSWARTDTAPFGSMLDHGQRVANIAVSTPLRIQRKRDR